MKLLTTVVFASLGVSHALANQGMESVAMNASLANANGSSTSAGSKSDALKTTLPSDSTGDLRKIMPLKSAKTEGNEFPVVNANAEASSPDDDEEEIDDSIDMSKVTVIQSEKDLVKPLPIINDMEDVKSTMISSEKKRNDYKKTAEQYTKKPYDEYEKVTPPPTYEVSNYANNDKKKAATNDYGYTEDPCNMDFPMPEQADDFVSKAKKGEDASSGMMKLTSSSVVVVAIASILVSFLF